MPAPLPVPMGEALATLSHELRDPLATILLALDLHPGDGDPAARRALATGPTRRGWPCGSSMTSSTSAPAPGAG